MKAVIAFSLIAAIGLSQTKQLEPKLYALGERLRADILKDFPLLEIPEASSLLTRLASELDPTTPAVNFEIVRSNQTEICVLPGGFALIPARLLLAVQSEDDLARRMAHAIAHIRLRHGILGPRPATTATMDSIPLIHAGGWDGIHRNPTNATTALPSGFRAYQERWERQAEAYAAVLLATRNPSATNSELHQVQAQLLPLTNSSKPPSLLR